jgi:gamma-glutamylcyclotransferase (GGCT)/AIG2-like uncharacterized protein YtfP
MPEKKRTLFVYGTLLAGEREHARLAGAERLGPARTEAIFQLVDLGAYPALVADGTTAIHGELYRLERSALRDLDVFEQVPILFQRMRIPLADGSQVDAYAMSPDQVRGRRRIGHGDWRRRFVPSVRTFESAFARWARSR